MVLCASETRTGTSRTQENLDVFRQWNLGKIIGITWKDKATNAKVLTSTEKQRLQYT